MEKFVIVGLGGAGYTAGIYASRYGMNPLIIGEADGGMIVGNHTVENFSGYADPVGGHIIMANMRKQAESFGTRIVQDRISEILPLDSNDFSKGFDIRTSMSGNFQTKMLMLGLGTQKVKLGAKGESDFFGRGVSYCATCDGFFYRGKTVGVVGGGDTALIEALYLSEICAKVYIIHRRNSFRGETIWYDRAKSKGNIEFITPGVIDEIYGEMKIGGIKISKGVGVENFQDAEIKESLDLPLDGLFVAIGTTPNEMPGLDPFLKRDEQGYIIVNSHQMTSVPGVFAAGDCTTASARFRQLITACSEGAIAAEGAFQFMNKS